MSFHLAGSANVPKVQAVQAVQAALAAQAALAPPTRVLAPKGADAKRFGLKSIGAPGDADDLFSGPLHGEETWQIIDDPSPPAPKPKKKKKPNDTNDTKAEAEARAALAGGDGEPGSPRSASDDAEVGDKRGPGPVGPVGPVVVPKIIVDADGQRRNVDDLKEAMAAVEAKMREQFLQLYFGKDPSNPGEFEARDRAVYEDWVAKAGTDASMEKELQLRYKFYKQSKPQYVPMMIMDYEARRMLPGYLPLRTVDDLPFDLAPDPDKDVVVLQFAYVTGTDPVDRVRICRTINQLGLFFHLKQPVRTGTSAVPVRGAPSRLTHKNYRYLYQNNPKVVPNLLLVGEYMHQSKLLGSDPERALRVVMLTIHNFQNTNRVSDLYDERWIEQFHAQEAASALDADAKRVAQAQAAASAAALHAQMVQQQVQQQASVAAVNALARAQLLELQQRQAEKDEEAASLKRQYDADKSAAREADIAAKAAQREEQRLAADAKRTEQAREKKRKEAEAELKKLSKKEAVERKEAAKQATDAEKAALEAEAARRSIGLPALKTKLKKAAEAGYEPSIVGLALYEAAKTQREQEERVLKEAGRAAGEAKKAARRDASAKSRVAQEAYRSKSRAYTAAAKVYDEEDKHQLRRRATMDDRAVQLRYTAMTLVTELEELQHEYVEMDEEEEQTHDHRMGLFDEFVDAYNELTDDERDVFPVPREPQTVKNYHAEEARRDESGKLIDKITRQSWSRAPDWLDPFTTIMGVVAETVNSFVAEGGSRPKDGTPSAASLAEERKNALTQKEAVLEARRNELRSTSGTSTAPLNKAAGELRREISTDEEISKGIQNAVESLSYLAKQVMETVDPAVTLQLGETVEDNTDVAFDWNDKYRKRRIETLVAAQQFARRSGLRETGGDRAGRLSYMHNVEFTNLPDDYKDEQDDLMVGLGRDFDKKMMDVPKLEAFLDEKYAKSTSQTNREAWTEQINRDDQKKKRRPASGEEVLERLHKKAHMQLEKKGHAMQEELLEEPDTDDEDAINDDDYDMDVDEDGHEIQGVYIAGEGDVGAYWETPLPDDDESAKLVGDFPIPREQWGNPTTADGEPFGRALVWGDFWFWNGIPESDPRKHNNQWLASSRPDESVDDPTVTAAAGRYLTSRGAHITDAMLHNWLAEDDNANTARVQAELRLRPGYRGALDPDVAAAERDAKRGKLARLMMAEEEIDAEERAINLASAALREAREARLKMEAEVAEREAAAAAPSSPSSDDSSDDEAEEAPDEAPKPASGFRLGLGKLQGLVKRQAASDAAPTAPTPEQLAAARASGLADRLARLGGLAEGAARWNNTGMWFK